MQRPSPSCLDLRRRCPRRRQDDPDLDINFAQPDFTLVALPTTLRLPKFKSAFRVTHRFTRPLGDGEFRRPGRGSVRPRHRRADRPRVPLRPHARHTGRHSPHVGSHDRVLHAARSRGGGKLASGHHLRARHDGRHEQLPGQLLARSGRRDLANTRRARRALPRAHLGEQLEPAAVGGRGRERHVHGGHGRAHPRAPDRLPGGRGRASRVWK